MMEMMNMMIIIMMNDDDEHDEHHHDDATTMSDHHCMDHHHSGMMIFMCIAHDLTMDETQGPPTTASPTRDVVKTYPLPPHIYIPTYLTPPGRVLAMVVAW